MYIDIEADASVSYRHGAVMLEKATAQRSGP